MSERTCCKSGTELISDAADVLLGRAIFDKDWLRPESPAVRLKQKMMARRRDSPCDEHVTTGRCVGLGLVVGVYDCDSLI